MTSGFLWPFVSWCWSSCASSRLALDDAIRHKQLNISSRFSPRVAGENDFLQTVINKVIAAKEVNHKGQGTYCSFYTLVYVKMLIARFSAWDCYNHGVKGHNSTNTVVWYQKLYLCCFLSFKIDTAISAQHLFAPVVSPADRLSFLFSVPHWDISVFLCWKLLQEVCPCAPQLQMLSSLCWRKE